MRDCADGSARRTVKPSPRSAVRGTITCLIASHWNLSPAAGSLPGKKLMSCAPSLCREHMAHGSRPSGLKGARTQLVGRADAVCSRRRTSALAIRQAVEHLDHSPGEHAAPSWCRHASKSAARVDVNAVDRPSQMPSRHAVGLECRRCRHPSSGLAIGADRSASSWAEALLAHLLLSSFRASAPGASIVVAAEPDELLLSSRRLVRCIRHACEAGLDGEISASRCW